MTLLPFIRNLQSHICWVRGLLGIFPSLLETLTSHCDISSFGFIDTLFYLSIHTIRHGFFSLITTSILCFFWGGGFFACARAMSRRSIKALRRVLTGSVKVQLCGAFECSGTARSRAGLNSVWAEVCQRWSSRHHRMSTGFTPRFSLGHSQSAAPPHTRWQKYSGSVPK